MTPPGTSNHTAAATMSAMPHSNSPTPSRRCSGSMSLGAVSDPPGQAPMPCAIASQIAATPRPSAVNDRATGPGPLRTARGAGRRAVERPFAVRAGAFDVLRDRELVLFFARLLPRLVEVVRLRDPVGEDVRVAMVFNLPIRHISPRDHRLRVVGRIGNTAAEPLDPARPAA